MDMSKYEMTDQPVFFQLSDPSTGLPLFEQKDDDGRKVDDPDNPVGVMIVGSDSEEFKRHMRRVTNKNLEASQKRRGKGMSAEELEEESQVTLAACIKEFHHIEWKGKTLVAPADCRLFIRVMPWAAEQIDRGMAERKIFMPALSKS